MLERVAVLIDGGNLYFKLRDLHISQLRTFNYRGLIEWLARDRKIVQARYYVGVVRAAADDEKAQALRMEQRKLFNHLQGVTQRLSVSKGYLMKNGATYHEKGVDVQLAVDLVVGAYENAYDTAILISSDTDLIPAMQKVKAKGKRIEYIGFSHLPSLAMQRHATMSRLLIREQILPYASRNPN